MSKRPIPKNYLNRGDVLNYISSLPLSEGHGVCRAYVKYGSLSEFHHRKMNEFMASRHEKTPQGGPAGQSTEGEYHV